jgi:hypothetical protein
MDLVALNDALECSDKTIEVFKIADQTNSKAASQIYQIAEPSLVLGREYALCGKYVRLKR